MFCPSGEDPGSNQPLYTRIQRIFMKSGLNNEIQKEVRVTVDLNSSLSKVSKQVLNIQLTNDDDPYFLYSLLITEEDYQHLRTSQGLLVDFHNFPTQVIRLFEQCSVDSSQGQRFLLFLEEDNRCELIEGSPSVLKVVETNNFKHLCHLFLNIQKGNDSDIKKLMQKKIKQLKEKVCKDEKYISQLESQVQNQASHLEARQNELLKLQQLWNEEKIAFKSESNKELSEETEKLRKSQIEWKMKIQKDWAESEEKNLNIIKEKELEASKLRIENQILSEKLSHSESTLKEKIQRIDSLEKDLTSIKWEFSSLKKQSSKLDLDYHEKEKTVHKLRTNLAVAEQELKDKSILMGRQQELLTVANEQKSQLEEALSEKEKQIQRKVLSLQSVTDELVKANEIITKLQKELSITTAKLKVRTGIALEQEKVVESSKKKITELEEALKLRDRKINSLLETEKSLKNSIAEFKDTIEMRDKTIQDNENVISWLNKRIDSTIKESSSPKSNINYNANSSSPTASTPFTHLRGGDNPLADQSLSALYTAVPTIAGNTVRSDNLETIQEITGGEATCSTNVDVGMSSNSVKARDPILKTPLSAVNSSKPSTSKASEQNSLPSKPAVNKPPLIGFKRVSINQTSTVPSSYFLK